MPGWDDVAFMDPLQSEGKLWQPNYFDRLIRDTGHFANAVRYIRRNPERAGLRGGEFLMWEAELVREVFGVVGDPTRA